MQFLAALERSCALGIYIDSGAVPWVAASASLAFPCRESAKAAELHAIACFQGVSDFIQYKVDDAIEITLVEMRVLRRQFLYEFGLDHRVGFQIGGTGETVPSSGSGVKFSVERLALKIVVTGKR